MGVGPLPLDLGGVLPLGVGPLPLGLGGVLPLGVGGRYPGILSLPSKRLTKLNNPLPTLRKAFPNLLPTLRRVLPILLPIPKITLGSLPINLNDPLKTPPKL